MTHEKFVAALAAIPTEELLFKVREGVTKLCSTGGRSFSMHVPPQLDDLDLIVTETARRLKVATELLETHEHYLSFLNTANEGPILIAANHHWECPIEDIQRGVAFRNRIESLKLELNENIVQSVEQDTQNNKLRESEGSVL